MSAETDRADSALRDAFAELQRGEATGAPPFAQLMARPPSTTTLGARAPRRPALERDRDSRAKRRSWASASAVRGLVPSLAAAAAVVVAAATGVWLGRTQPAPGARDIESLATWVAPTDFLLDTPAAELLRTTPAIPGPLPLDLAATPLHLPTGDSR